MSTSTKRGPTATMSTPYPFHETGWPGSHAASPASNTRKLPAGLPSASSWGMSCSSVTGAPRQTPRRHSSRQLASMAWSAAAAFQ
jgi:hypothetical protein